MKRFQHEKEAKRLYNSLLLWSIYCFFIEQNLANKEASKVKKKKHRKAIKLAKKKHKAKIRLKRNAKANPIKLSKQGLFASPVIQQQSNQHFIKLKPN
jgi:hypothetical protein